MAMYSVSIVKTQTLLLQGEGKTAAEAEHFILRRLLINPLVYKDLPATIETREMGDNDY